MDGFAASLIVIGYRLLAPLTILRWPLAGILLAIVADTSDAMVFEKTGWGLFAGSAGYSYWDKGLDIWYLLFAWLATRKYWTEPLARYTANWLFWWRATGVMTFFIWPHRIIFVLAPSIFENFYIIWTAIQKWRPLTSWWRQLTIRRLVVIILVAAIPKIIQEYLMHYRFVDQTWNFFRTHFFWWLY